MRVDTPEFADRNDESNRSPVYVIELSFDTANTDIHYLTSAPVSGLTGNIINDTLKMVSATSQKINPEKARSTIGTMKFECLDVGLTTLQRTKLGENKGLNGKRVRLHVGFEGMLWDDYSMIKTQIIDGSISYKDGVYKFNCADITREMRKDIFDVKTTALRASINETQTTLPVFTTSGFDVVYQVPSADGKTLLRGLQDQGTVPGGIDDVGFIKIEGEGEEFEIAMWTTKSADEFTQVYRGVLGTKPLNIEVEPNANPDDAPKITEYVYLEMSAIKTAYALATGSLYGHAGKFLPDHWHLGISTDYINTASHVNVGADLWDLSDDDNGYPCSIRGQEKTDGKRFISEKLLYMVGCFHTVQQSGELKLNRVQEVAQYGSYVKTLNEDNVITHGDLTHNLKEVVNRFVIKWNYSDRKEDTTRVRVFLDPTSIARHGESTVKTLELPTLHGSRHTYQMIKYHFDAVRTRLAGPPLRINVECLPECNNLEVGDIVRLNLDNLEDFSNDATNLDRNFEIQSVSHNWKTGSVKLSLFGSSERSSDLAPDETEPVGTTIGDLGSIISNGTEINSTNFPGAVSSSGGVTTVSSDITLSGSTTLGNSSSVFYCAEDLTIDASAEVFLDDNVILVSLGFLQLNGKINGKGRGYDGGLVGDDFNATENGHIFSQSQHLGTPGIGNTTPQGGFVYTRNQGFIFIRPKGVIARNDSNVSTDRNVTGVYPVTPRPLLTYSDTSGIQGFPSTLMGSSGSSGVGCWDYTGNVDNGRGASGGAGANGGAGLMIISEGMAFGAAGEIDLSGDDGSYGGSVRPDTTGTGAGPGDVILYGGAGGGGHPGGLVYVNTDSVQATPTFDTSNTILEVGECPRQGSYRTDSRTVITGYGLRSYSSGKEPGKYAARVNTVEQNVQVVFLDTSRTATADLPDYVETDPTFVLQEQINANSTTPEVDGSIIEVSVTPPAGDDNYSYSNVYYRVSGSSVWINAQPASNESLIHVPSDGETYEVQIRAVAVSTGFESPTGPTDTITVTDINGRTNAELAIDYPLIPISGLSLRDASGNYFTGMGPFWDWDTDNNELVYFQYYGIEIRDGSGNVLRTERSVSPFYEYTYEKNREDYTRIEGTKGVYNDLELRVNAVSKVRNNLNEYYGNATAISQAIATNDFDRENLRFYLAFEQQILDDIANAGGGGTLTTYYTPTQPASPTTGDLWFDTDDDNKIYRYNGTTWDSAQDSGIAAAVNAAQTAQTTADGKALVFYQTTAPTGMSEGDLWYSSTTKLIQRYDGSVWELVGNSYSKTSELEDDDNLGGTADWDGIPDRPTDSELLNSQQEWDDIQNAKVQYLAANAYTAAADGDAWAASHKTGTVIFEISNASSDWPDNYGGVVTTWFESDRAKQVFYNADAGFNYEWVRTINPSGWPNWTAWQRMEIYDSADVDALQTQNIDDVSNNATPYNLVVVGDLTVQGAKVTKNSNSGYTQYFYSSESYQGGAFVSFVADQNDGAIFIALNADPLTDGNYTSHDCGIYLRDDGFIRYRLGAGNSSGASTSDTYAAGDTFTLVYDGRAVHYYHNGVLQHSDSSIADNLTLHLDSAWGSSAQDCSVSSIAFGPYAPYTSGDTENVNGVPSTTITSDLTQALSDAANAQATADGKIVTFYQGTTPSGADVGDLWFDTSSDNLLRRYNGSSWVQTDDLRIASAVTAANNAQTTADGKALVYSQESTPSGTEGDLWFTPSTGVVRRHNGSSWVIMTLEADYVKANVAISAPTITGGSISGNTIDGATITGGTLQTASGNAERVVIDDTDNSVKVYFDDDSGGGVQKHVDIGLGSADASGNQYAIEIGSSTYSKDGIRIHTNNKLPLSIQTEYDIGIWSYAKKGDAMRVLSPARQGFGLHENCLGYGDFRSVIACAIPKTTIAVKGSPVKVISTLQIQGDSYLLEVDNAGGGDTSRASQIGILASDPDPTWFGNHDIYMTRNLNFYNTWVGIDSTHDLVYVYLYGVVPMLVNNGNGNISTGSLLRASTNTSVNYGVRQSDGYLSAPTIAKALASYSSSTAGIIPVKLI